MKFRIYIRTGTGSTSERHAVDHESETVPMIDRELVLGSGQRVWVTHLLDDAPLAGCAAHFAADAIDPPR